MRDIQNYFLTTRLFSLAKSKKPKLHIFSSLFSAYFLQDDTDFLSSSALYYKNNKKLLLRLKKKYFYSNLARIMYFGVKNNKERFILLFVYIKQN